MAMVLMSQVSLVQEIPNYNLQVLRLMVKYWKKKEMLFFLLSCITFYFFLVTFGAYRIFGCTGSSADDIIMKAMEKAYLDGMDVINLSLGDVGWPESPASLLADELALKGMIVCAAAGNEGDRGIFSVGAPSLGQHALSIASIDNKHALSHTFKIGDLTLGMSIVINCCLFIMMLPFLIAL